MHANGADSRSATAGPGRARSRRRDRPHRANRSRSTSSVAPASSGGDGDCSAPCLGPGRRRRVLGRGTARRLSSSYVDAGAIALGAFAGERLVGIGVVVLHLRPGVAQLAYLYVTTASRERESAAAVGRARADRPGRAGLADRRLGDAVREHGALLPASWLRAHGGAAPGALRARARGRAHAEGAVSAT